jgi:uncharacterized protein YbjT (DUF2867 family)
MILVTGAAGKTGQSIIRALAARKKSIRALVRDDSQVQQMKALGAHDVIVGDMQSGEVLKETFVEITAVYHICPNVNPDEFSIGTLVISEAKAAGVQRFVYHSVLHPQIESMSHHWHKLRIEEKIFESAIPFTILQPAAYMQNLLVHWDLIAHEGTYPIPYGQETKMSMVDIEDIAKVAALVLTEPGHEGAIYELSGSEVLSQTEVANIMGQNLGYPVRVKVIPITEWECNSRKRGMSDYQIKTLVKMFQYYEQFGFGGNSQVLENLLGHPASKLTDFVERTIKERKL